MASPEDTKIVNLQEYRLVREAEFEEVRHEKEERLTRSMVELLKQFDFVDERSQAFWMAMNDHQRLMAFYTVVNALFKGNCLDEVNSFHNFLHGYLNINVDAHPIVDIVMDACGAEIVWDTLSAGRDKFKEE